MTPMSLKSATPQSRVKRSTTEPLGSPFVLVKKTVILVHKLFKYRILFKIPADDNSCYAEQGHKVIKLSSCSTQLSLKFQLLKESNLSFFSSIKDSELYLSC